MTVSDDFPKNLTDIDKQRQPDCYITQNLESDVTIYALWVLIGVTRRYLV